MITKSDYFRACMNQSVGFLRACLTEPILELGARRA